MMARDRRERSTRRHANVLARDRTRLDIQNASLHRHNAELADKLKTLHDRVPVYTRIQQDEQRYGRTFVIPVTFSPDVIVRTLTFHAAEPHRQLDLSDEFRYIAAFASDKILATLQDAARDHFGMPARTR
jgi:hypothetical protein